MTMFRRVFSNHFDGQGKEPEVPKPTLLGSDIPPAPPSLPPQLIPHGRLPMTELTQLRPTASASGPAVQDDPVDADTSVAARAAEVHAKMVQREMQKPPRQTAETVEPLVPPATGSQGTVSSPRSGRARTRLLGFTGASDVSADPIAQAQAGATTETLINPAGWVAIIKGPGRGQHFALFSGVAMVGRGEDQGIRLDFGDQAISRRNHAALAYDTDDNKFYLGHGGKSNIIKLNGRPVLSTEEIFHGDTIRIGETILRFVALCDKGFQWSGADDA